MTELICIVCPRGCHLHVDEENRFAVTGNSCERGSEYGRTELQNPTRVLTSIVRIEGATGRCCPVKTDKAVPKKDIFRVMEVLRGLTIQAPVKTGDVLYADVCGTGAAWVATKDMEKGT
ncbi:MAG: DUF1667 domain-containing protein [Lachnospiraceae bacterium]|nr:DUF1667 domain-containing protein [Lachnospiraceae bacterium]